MKQVNVLFLLPLLLTALDLAQQKIPIQQGTKKNHSNHKRHTTAVAFQNNIPPPPPPSTSEAPVMRAWHCHGNTQKELVARLRQAKIIQSPAVQQVMEAVDRQHYIPNNPYQDAPQGLPKSQTISAPHMHAHVLEEILPVILKRSCSSSETSAITAQDHIKILDIGCGSGYLTACLGRWFRGAAPQQQHHQDDNNSHTPQAPAILPFRAQVYGMDIHPELVDLTRRNIAKVDGDLIKRSASGADAVDASSSPMIHLRVGNGWQGWPEEAPFDAIHVGAAAGSFPMALAQQLRLHGVLIVPVGPNGGMQTLLRVQRVDTSGVFRQDFRLTELLGVRYVPLVQGPE